ncbi:hypothetical protein GCM10010191_42890 [Actinomadura vinacea]|uniref:Uncharacterized protein n=1 Tax=Actinomadura vinacea TaxID=115336 RepID=A0ABN3JAP6_9ACTN
MAPPSLRLGSTSHAQTLVVSRWSTERFKVLSPMPFPAGRSLPSAAIDAKWARRSTTDTAPTAHRPPADRTLTAR